MSTEPRIIIYVKLNVSQAKNWNNKYIFSTAQDLNFWGVLYRNLSRQAQFYAVQRILSYTAKYSWRILLERLYSLSVYFKQAKILLAYSETTSYIENYHSKQLCSPCTLEDFWRILGRRFNTYGVFSNTIKHFSNIHRIRIKGKEYHKIYAL